MNSVENEHAAHLAYHNGRLVWLDEQAPAPVPARIMLARPLHSACFALSIMHGEERRELRYVEDYRCLPAAQRRLVEEELARRYLLPTITRVVDLQVNLGYYYWAVETDRGAQQFLTGSPATHLSRLPDGGRILRDTIGNAYRLAAADQLDPASQALLKRAL